MRISRRVNFIRYMYQLLMLAISCCLLTKVSAQTLQRQYIDEDWEFHKGSIGFPKVNNDTIKWQPVTLPHTYNKDDVMDDTPGYYRGEAWYRKKIALPGSWKNKCIYLRFDAVYQSADVYLNGIKIGHHDGGYTAFVFRIDQYLTSVSNNNELYVKVSNAYNDDIPPLSGDFTFFGGIYRRVSLEVTEPVHFTRNDAGADALYTHTPQVSASEASLDISGQIENLKTTRQNIAATFELIDPDGKQVTQTSIHIAIPNNKVENFKAAFAKIKDPLIWSPEHPNLYKVVCKLIDNDNQNVVDQLILPVGFRWFSFDVQKGFFLNGKPYKLWGVSHHQDHPGYGNAVPVSLYREDIHLIKEMGGNFVRIAHYPQDQSILEECDRLGIITSVEIPVVNTVTQSSAFIQHCLNMQKEMIHQNFDHPSVVIWGYMNEVLLRPRYGNDSLKQKKYFAFILQLAKKLDSFTRQEDPSRYTMMACHGNYSLYKNTGLLSVPRIVGWNLYLGWYSGTWEDFGPFLDNYHKDFPDKSTIITEYGADGDPRISSMNPKRFDKSVDYELLVHKHYFNDIQKRSFVSGAAVWNFADFVSETREETMPHINNKGLMTMDRIPKESYYFYQSKLLKSPYLKIASKNETLRGGTQDKRGTDICTRPLEIFSNRQQAVTVYLNGEKINAAYPVDGSAVIQVPFRNGINKITAITKVDDKIYSDEATINFQLQPLILKDTFPAFRQLNVNLGDDRYFVDDRLRQLWVPEQPYSPGSWGYLGGTEYELHKGRLGTDKNILGTNLDPVYQTQRTAIKEMKFDVPNGRYELSILLSELQGGINSDKLIYNLDTTKQAGTNKQERDFDIYVNNEMIQSGIGKDYILEPFKAYKISQTVTVADNRGITIVFKARKGQPILNGVQLRRTL